VPDGVLNQRKRVVEKKKRSGKSATVCLFQGLERTGGGGGQKGDAKKRGTYGKQFLADIEGWVKNSEGSF